MSLRSQIPAFYWYFCTYGDALLSSSAVYMMYFDPPTFMDPGFARDSPLGKITPSHLFLMHQSGGVFAAWVFLATTMLRETKEMKVWTRMQTALSFTDIAVLYSQFKALQAQSRLDIGLLRWEEGLNAVLVGLILLIRVCFVAGVGFRKSNATKKGT